MIINTFQLEADKLKKDISDLETEIHKEAELGKKTAYLEVKMWSLTNKYLKLTRPINSRVVFV